MALDDPHDLDRFVVAQDAAGTFERALQELRRGRKTSHWMWFVFPQIGGLGMSEMSRRYAVPGLDEARSYLAHEVLGDRLRISAGVVAQTENSSAEAIFGVIDAQKLHSSMTLFQLADPTEPVFGAVLDRFFQGRPDGETIRRAGGGPAAG